ncbi:hypothetical protein CMQ_4980 [Grosmannia clavigera kw1407]|uniref:Uncharacterized protein n=1 Tax=Grosmannia clavigera (strain kw1407 / UAMH 11150) TaxID=655863 RepID=F0XK74_GROCL|nr:uncharacterized protein CMQ_4980 [Grosmannia clavigera kw1407]EFX01909.1 hypothetical protein CMQ_4980 [Grosmannia clavigera kw1407]
MATPTTFLAIALGLLAIDAAIELGFVTSMVAFLHSGAPSGVYEVRSSSSTSTYNISGVPLRLLVNQGHTSNGAAGTALVLICIVGVIALTGRRLLLSPSSRKGGVSATLAAVLYYVWVALQIPALLLTVGALGYVFTVTHRHSGQTIDQNVAAQIHDAATQKYPLDSWTPQSWFSAVTEQLTFVDPGLRANLIRHLRIMRGWQYNLIPLFLLQLAETIAAILDFRHWRNGSYNHSYNRKQSGSYDGPQTSQV